jgi:uncharacterized protein YkwD
MKRRKWLFCMTTGVQDQASPAYFQGGKQQALSLSKACLFAHNALRAKHGVSELKWDTKLAAAAQVK